jgi:REP element-mobilizing transposase RayT
MGTENAWTGWMGRRLHCYLPHVVYEITIRTVQGRYLLRPGDASRELILGVLGRALSLYPSVALHGFVYLSNHAHLLLSSDDARSIPSFLCYVNGNVAVEMGRLHRWKGPVWGGACTPVLIADNAALVARLRYVLSQSVKEGLVERPEQWPGASCIPWFLGEKLIGTWIFRERQTRAMRRRSCADATAFSQRYEVTIAPLPCWKEYSRDEIQRLVKSIIEEIVVAERLQRKTHPMGAAAATRTDPHRARKPPSSAPAPLCHASNAAIRSVVKSAYREFVCAFRAAAAAAKSRLTSSEAQFPIGSSPRPRWFVSPPAGYVPPWMMIHQVLHPAASRLTF